MDTMEALVSIAEKADVFIKEIKGLASEWKIKLKSIIGSDDISQSAACSLGTASEEFSNFDSPKQVKKRPKRLSSLDEESIQDSSRSSSSSGALKFNNNKFRQTSNSSISSTEAFTTRKSDNDKQNIAEAISPKSSTKIEETVLQKRNSEKDIQRTGSEKELVKKNSIKDLQRTSSDKELVKNSVKDLQRTVSANELVRKNSEKELQKRNSQKSVHRKNSDKNLLEHQENNVPSIIGNSTFTVADVNNVTSSSKEDLESRSNISSYQGRPQRAAKLKTEKNYKEPSLRHKLRQENSMVKVKLEHEQRPSQMHEKGNKNKAIQKQNDTISTEAVTDKAEMENFSDSILEVPVKRLSTITLDSSTNDDENVSETATTSNKNNDQKKITKTKNDDSIVMTGRQLRVKIKREKGSFIESNIGTTVNEEKSVESNQNLDDAVFKVPAAPGLTGASSATSSSKNTKSESHTTNKKDTTTRKKKNAAYKPIKVERFSDINVIPSPIALRTRKGSLNRQQQQQQQQQQEIAIKVLEQGKPSEDKKSETKSNDEEEEEKHETSIYEDALPAVKSTEEAQQLQSRTFSTNSTDDTKEYISPHLNCNESIKDNFEDVAGTNSAEFGRTTFVVDTNLNKTVTLGKTMTIESNEKLTTNQVNGTFEVLPGLANTTITTMQATDDEHRSFVTAMDSSECRPQMSSLLTEDDNDDDDDKYTKIIANKLKSQSKNNIPNNVREKNLPDLKVAAMKSKPVLPLKTLKSSERPKELFNPLMQSPVKLRVEAFEHVAAANTISNQLTTSSHLSRLPKAKKENIGPTSNRTPTLSKLNIPGRFLTPTQTTNTNNIPTGAVKKLPNSTSKIYQVNKLMGSQSTLSTTTIPGMTTSNIMKSGSGMMNSMTGSITRSTSSLARTISRDNSAEEIRKGLQSSAEERKKLREEKHLQAALQREAKERERAERIVKLNKEREEKRLKLQMENEQKKRELEEISRKLKQGEIIAESKAARAKAAKVRAIAEKEREMLLKIKEQQTQHVNYHQHNQAQHMLPPEPRQPKYTFEMLHADDSTDEETKISYKRPQPPSWSRSHVKGPSILLQQHMSTGVIDSFFSVQPMTPDLRTIFPAIDDRFLKRNSSVLWSTPPRYSELPKY